nr:aldo/keto reductase [Saprospiraceae bacterium]
MKRTALAHDLEIAPVISGLWQIADQERKEGQLDPDQRVDVMHEFVAAGFTTFDMADHYGSSELIAGHFTARHPTEEVQFLTKWVPPLGSITAKTTREAVDLALERLQTSSLDLLQYHAWRYSDPRWLDGLHHL